MLMLLLLLLIDPLMLLVLLIRNLELLLHAADLEQIIGYAAAAISLPLLLFRCCCNQRLLIDVSLLLFR